MSSFVSWAGKVLDSVDEGAASALQKALKNDSESSVQRQEQDDKTVPDPAPIDHSSPEAITAATASSPMSSKDEQILSLTKVWSETRDELARVKGLLRSRDAQHRQSMEKLRDQIDARVSTKMESSSERISLLEKRLAESVENRELLQNQVEAMKAQIEELSATNGRLIQEKDELQLELNQAVVDRSLQIQALQDEFDQKVKELKDNAIAASQSLQQFRDLESKLLSDKEQYATALVQSDRDLQKISVALRNTQEDKQRLQAEYHVLQSRLAECQSKLEQALANEQHALQEVANHGARLEAALKSQADTFERDRVQLENRISNLTSQLKSSSADAGMAAKVDTLQRKVEALTKTLLQRQAEIERIGSVSSSLGLQLDNERARCLKLEEERRALEQRLSEAINSPDYDHGFRRRRLRPYQYKLTSKILDVFDNMGTSITRVMRVSARVRIALVIYIVLIHIWVLYILSHLARTSTSSDRLIPA